MKEFFYILIAALVSSALGAGFGYGLAHHSPHVVCVYDPSLAASLKDGRHVEEVIRLGTGLGAVAGLLMGAGAMTAGLFISALRSRWDDR